MKIRRLVPFSVMPASWGLHGKAYKEAEAYYNYTGKDLDIELARIHYTDKELEKKLLAVDLVHKDIDLYEHDKKLLEIDGLSDAKSIAGVELKHGKITESAYDVIVATEDYPEGVDRELAFLEVKMKHGEITKIEFDKQVATLLEKPWIGIVDQGFDPDEGINGVYFEFDWNTYWIDYLQGHGITGHTDKEIVETWFQSVCRATAASSGEVMGEDMPLASKVRPPRHGRDDKSFY